MRPPHKFILERGVASKQLHPRGAEFLLLVVPPFRGFFGAMIPPKNPLKGSTTNLSIVGAARFVQKRRAREPSGVQSPAFRLSRDTLTRGL